MLGGRRRVPATLLGVAAAPSRPTRLSAWLLPAKSARPVPLGHAAPHASAEGRVTARPRPRTQGRRRLAAPALRETHAWAAGLPARSGRRVSTSPQETFSTCVLRRHRGEWGAACALIRAAVKTRAAPGAAVADGPGASTCWGRAGRPSKPRRALLRAPGTSPRQEATGGHACAVSGRRPEAPRGRGAHVGACDGPGGRPSARPALRRVYVK